MKNLQDRKPCWQTLGMNIPDGSTTDEIMEIIGWDYKVEITDAVVELPVNPLESLSIPFPNKRVTYRTDSFTPLGIVGDRYHVLQNHEVMNLVDALIGQEWQPLCGGTMREGATSWIVGKLPYTPKSGEFEPNLAVQNSFDMSSGLRFANTPLRPTCNNVVQFMMKNSSFVLKHSKHMDVRFNEARNALNLATAYVEKLDEEIERLLSISVEVPDAQVLVNKIITVHSDVIPGQNLGKNYEKISDRAVAIRQQKQDEILRHWLTTESIEDIRFTGWGWINAVNEMEQWTVTSKRNSRMMAEKTLASALNSVGANNWTNIAYRSLRDQSFKQAVKR